MFRMLFLTFYGSFRGTKDQAHHLHESPKNMTLPLIILAVFSTISGFFGLPEIFSHTHALHEYLRGSFILSDARFSIEHPSHTLEYAIIGVSIVVVALIYVFANKRYAKDEYLLPEDESAMSLWQRLSYRRFYIDEFYHAIVTQSLNKLSTWFYQSIDNSFINAIVNLVSKTTVDGSKALRSIQTGYTGFYLFAMVAGIIIILLLNFILS